MKISWLFEIEKMNSIFFMLLYIYIIIKHIIIYIIKHIIIQGANSLWNNLLQPIGNKTTFLTSLFKTFLCPTSKRPYLITRENS